MYSKKLIFFRGDNIVGLFNLKGFLLSKLRDLFISNLRDLLFDSLRDLLFSRLSKRKIVMIFTL